MRQFRLLINNPHFCCGLTFGIPFNALVKGGELLHRRSSSTARCDVLCLHALQNFGICSRKDHSQGRVGSLHLRSPVVSHSGSLWFRGVRMRHALGGSGDLVSRYYVDLYVP